MFQADTIMRFARRLQGLTLHDISQVAGVSVSTLASIERGLAEPNERVLKKIASTIGLPREALLRRIEPSLLEAAMELVSAHSS